MWTPVLLNKFDVDGWLVDARARINDGWRSLLQEKACKELLPDLPKAVPFDLEPTPEFLAVLLSRAPLTIPALVSHFELGYLENNDRKDGMRELKEIAAEAWETLYPRLKDASISAAARAAAMKDAQSDDPSVLPDVVDAHTGAWVGVCSRFGLWSKPPKMLPALVDMFESQPGGFVGKLVIEYQRLAISNARLDEAPDNLLEFEYLFGKAAAISKIYTGAHTPSVNFMFPDTASVARIIAETREPKLAADPNVKRRRMALAKNRAVATLLGAYE